MPTDFKLPDLGEGVTGGDVVQVLVSPGDTIKAEQTILELETDKAVLEVPCSIAGKVVTVHVKPGQHIDVGATLVTVESGEAADSPAPASQAAPAQAESKPAPTSQAAEKKPPKPAATPQRKAPDAPAPARKQAADKGGQKPALVQTPMPPLNAEAEAAPAEPAAAAEPAKQPVLAAGPATRRLARELGVDIEAVAAAHPGQRLTEELLKAHVREGRPASAESRSASAAPPLPDFKQWGDIERVPFTSLQRKTAEALLTSWTTAPQVTQFDVADITSLESLRRRYRDAEPSKDVKLTVMAFMLKALTVALKAYPQFNASLDAQAQELILKRYYHIGVAVDTEAGLIVPVLRDVDRKNVLTIAAELVELADRTRKRKIALEELRGGTFTVTNLGGIGGTAFTPIVNFPDVAILGLGRTREEPFMKDGQLKTRLVLPLCLSYDHRVINGADGARFIRKLSGLLEDPELLLLGA